MAESMQQIRSYEISIWTLQDRFLSVLKWATMNQRGQLQDPEMTLRDDGTQELSFTIPKYYWEGDNRIPNPMWLHMQDQPLEANMHKLKVIFNKNTEDEDVFEFLVTSVASDHTQDRVDISVKAEGLAFHELGKVGYKIELSETLLTDEMEEWANGSMIEDPPKNNIQYWNDKVFKDSKGNWRTNWTYRVEMDWSSYSQATGDYSKSPSKVYEDEYVSSWQLDAAGGLVPRYTKGYKEKYRIVDIKESNIYNITQTIAEQFGVFCRYEYEHDASYQIIGRTVVYYNNYIMDKEGHIDLTYPYSSSGITRTVDNSEITTKMYVTGVEEGDELISIIDVDANKSGEDYLMNFEYLHDIQAVNDDQYEEIQKYEATMYQYNRAYSKLTERRRILTNQIVDLDAEYTTYTNAKALDQERFDEANRGLLSLTNGGELVKVDTTFIVMRDDEKGYGLYINMRFEGMVRESIQLYAKNNFVTMSGEQYSSPLISWDCELDQTTGDIVRLTHLQGADVIEGNPVYLSGYRDPKHYYETLMNIWAERQALDTAKADKAEETADLYRWYLYGSRADYGLVDSARVEDSYHGLAIVAPVDDEAELRDWLRGYPFVNAYADLSRVGNNEDVDEEKTALEMYTYDHFEQLDEEQQGADIYYLLEHYTDLMAVERSRFERMMGPALREGYWQPDDYHNYGDMYDAAFTNIRADRVNLSTDSLGNFDNFIKGSHVWATSQSQSLSPYLQFIWDCNKYYEDEEPFVYTSSINNRKDSHLAIDLSKCMEMVKVHLDDLCFFYSYPSSVSTIYDIKEQKLANLKTDLARFKDSGIYDGNKKPNVTGYEKLQWFINRIFNTDGVTINARNKYQTSYTDQGIAIDNFVAIDHLKTSVTNLQNTGLSYIDLAQEDNSAELESLIDCAESLYNLKTRVEAIQKACQSDANNANTSDDEKKICNEAVTYGTEQIKRITAAYNYLMSIDSTVVSLQTALTTNAINKTLNSSGYTTLDCGLVTLIQQYATYTHWLTSLDNGRYCSYAINSQCELGWILDTNPSADLTSYGDHTKMPALIITAAKTLDDDTIRFLVNGEYSTSELNGEKYETVWHKVTDEEYKPFLGYYEQGKDNDGNPTLTPVILYRLSASDFIGATESNGYTRNLAVADYDKSNNPRQPEANEYRYRRVYPRLFFETLKLKQDSTELFINLNNSLLTALEDYQIAYDDRSKGQVAQGIGYYVTLKPHTLFKLGSSTGRLDINYSLSNADVSIYLDAIKIMKENAYPKVTYDVELSVLNPAFIHTAYKRLNQIVHINDIDLELEEASGYISEVSLKLDMPWEDSVEIKNYTTKFEDLFSTIVAQTEAMKKAEGGLDTALQAFSRTTGLLDADTLYNSILSADLNLSFNKGKLTIDQNEGIWGISDDGVVAFRGGGIFTATEHDASGNWIWNTGILPSGINASLITTGQLDTNKIKVYAGDQLRFQLNGEGLYAYKSYTSESDDLTKSAIYTEAMSGLDSKQYVVFNSEGLFLHADEGAIHASGSAPTASGLIVQNYETIPFAVDRVEVSWKGLILRNWKGNEVFYADPDTGDLTLEGAIIASKGTIAGWEISEHALTKNGLSLKSGPEETDIGIELHSSGISIDVETDSNGQYYYPYNPVVNGAVQKSTVYYMTSGSRVDVTIAKNQVYYLKTTRYASVMPLYQKRESISTQGKKDDTGTDENNEVLNLQSSIDSSVEVKIYVMRDSAKTIYAVDNKGEKVEYSGDTSLTASWYTKIKAADPNNYESYVLYTHEPYFQQQKASDTMILRPQGSDEATFFAYANNGDVLIRQGKIGNFGISNQALSGGTLQGATLTTDNNINGVDIGHLIYGIRSDSATGIIYLKQVDGTEENFNIAAMQAYKDAVAAAAKLTLTLNVAGKPYIFTAP